MIVVSRYFIVPLSDRGDPCLFLANSVDSGSLVRYVFQYLRFRRVR